MRRLLAILTVLVACSFGLPATAQAAPTPIGGGSVLSTLGGARCTAGFAATSADAGYLIAGPGCPSGNLYIGGVLVGPSTTRPGYSVVRVTNTAAWTLVPWVDGTVTIGGSTPAPIGGGVCLIDTRTGTRCGTVTARNQTINFPQGVITGLTRTNICLEPGGGAVAYLSGDQAQGVPVGGSGNCSSGGVSYFQPVNPILAAYGLTLLTG
jgi:hypothetical protein